MYHRTYFNRPIPPQPDYSPYGYYNFPPQQDMNYPQTPMDGNMNNTPYDYFQKPEQPMNWPNNMPFEQNQFQQQQPQTPPKLISQFQKENGQLDLDKVLGTVGQFANTYHQVAPIVQQFGSFMKNFRAGS